MEGRTIGEKLIALIGRVTENEKDIAEIKGNLSKIIWIVLTAIITAILALVLKQ